MNPTQFAGTGIVVLGLVVWIVCAVLAYRRAPSLGRRAWVWGAVGAIGGPFALFALILCRGREDASSTSRQAPPVRPERSRHRAGRRDVATIDAARCADADRHPSQPDALAAVDRPRREPRPGGAAATRLHPDHRRVRGHRRHHRAARGRRERRVGGGPAELREADPDDLATEAARGRRGPVRRRLRGPGRCSLVPGVCRSSTSRRGSVDRRSTRSATGCSPSSSRSTGAASRSAPTSPAATSERSSSRSSGRRSSPTSAGARPSSCSGFRRSSSPSGSCCSSARAATTRPRPSPTAASARRSGRSSATPTTAGSTWRRCSAAAGAGSGSSTSSRCSTSRGSSACRPPRPT